MFKHVNTKHALCGHVFSRCWPSDMRFMCLPLKAHSSNISKCICSKHNSPYRELINHGYQCSYMLAHRPINMMSYKFSLSLVHRRSHHASAKTTLHRTARGWAGEERVHKEDSTHTLHQAFRQNGIKIHFTSCACTCRERDMERLTWSWVREVFKGLNPPHLPTLSQPNC